MVTLSPFWLAEKRSVPDGFRARLRGVAPPQGTKSTSGQRAARLIDGDDRDAVMSAIRTIEEAAVRRDLDIGAMVAVPGLGRDSRQRVDERELPGGRVDGEVANVESSSFMTNMKRPSG